MCFFLPIEKRFFSNVLKETAKTYLKCLEGRMTVLAMLTHSSCLLLDSATFLLKSVSATTSLLKGCSRNCKLTLFISITSTQSPLFARETKNLIPFPSYFFFIKKKKLTSKS